MSGECEKCGDHTLECRCRVQEAAAYIMPFGKHKGRPLRDLPFDYKSWIVQCGGERGQMEWPQVYAYLKILLEDNNSIDPSVEKVNHPSHYQGQKFEVIDIIEDFHLGFSLGNAIKYILRAGKKGLFTEDLKKAIWYLQREIDHPS